MPLGQYPVARTAGTRISGRIYDGLSLGPAATRIHLTVETGKLPLGESLQISFIAID